MLSRDPSRARGARRDGQAETLTAVRAHGGLGRTGDAVPPETFAGPAFQLRKGHAVRQLGAMVIWAACGFVLTPLVLWQVLLGAALVLAALAAWVYLGGAAAE